MYNDDGNKQIGINSIDGCDNVEAQSLKKTSLDDLTKQKEDVNVLNSDWSMNMGQDSGGVTDGEENSTEGKYIASPTTPVNQPDLLYTFAGLL